MRAHKTPYYSYRIGTVAKGCQMCVKGLKEVLFVTGLCSQKCFFCPLSEAKRNKDVVYANEWPVRRFDDILTEAKLCDAQGAGITGGDPMLKLGRTVRIIQMLKNNFGQDFHVHLYTPLPRVNLENLKRLYRAGLDEIRFHPELTNSKHWPKIMLGRKFPWSVGVEIPVIPGHEFHTKKLIDHINGKVDFLNLNELEISSTNAKELFQMGFVAKNSVSYGVMGSEEMALKLLGYCKALQLRAHYCTTTLKDRVQLAKRIKRRAGNVAKPFDYVTREGMLIRGAVYVKGLVPGFDYRKRISEANKNKVLLMLKDLKKTLRQRFHIDNSMLIIDDKKLRLLTSSEIVKRLAKKIPNQCAIVEEYPTYDQFEVEVEFL